MKYLTLLAPARNLVRPVVSVRAFSSTVTVASKPPKYEVDPGWDRKDATISEADVKADNDPNLPKKPNAELQKETIEMQHREHVAEKVRDAHNNPQFTESENNVRADQNYQQTNARHK